MLSDSGWTRGERSLYCPRMSVIKFGTSGRRGIMSEAFTFANVERAARAIAEYLKENPPPKAKRLLIVGHDTRFRPAALELVKP
jgi:phosphomannomutase